MSRGIINGLFGLTFNLATAAFILWVLLLIVALRGSIDMVWIARAGIILQILGVLLFVLEYMGVTQQGHCPLRWWLGKLAREDTDTSASSFALKQTLLAMGAGMLIMGLLLQLLYMW